MCAHRRPVLLRLGLHEVVLAVAVSLADEAVAAEKRFVRVAPDAKVLVLVDEALGLDRGQRTALLGDGLQVLDRVVLRLSVLGVPLEACVAKVFWGGERREGGGEGE
jgi:hypothetical protein